MEQIREILHKKKYSGSRQLIEFIRDNMHLIVTDRTLRHYSHDLHFKWGKPRRVPTLTEDHKKKRLAWALAHRDTDWHQWIFTDESIFRAGRAPVGERYIPGEEHVVETKTWSGKFHVWWGIHFSLSIPYAEITGNMNSDEYVNILQVTLPVRSRRTWIFQFDGARVHTSRISKNWLNTNQIRFCDDWPAKSPDLNPIENLWSIVGYQVRIRQPTNVVQLKRYVIQEMQRICRHMIKILIDSMPHRIEAVIAAKGGHTKY
jgi:hypothetical protein